MLDSKGWLLRGILSLFCNIISHVFIHNLMLSVHKVYFVNSIEIKGGEMRRVLNFDWWCMCWMSWCLFGLISGLDTLPLWGAAFFRYRSLQDLVNWENRATWTERTTTFSHFLILGGHLLLLVPIFVTIWHWFPH